MECYTLAELSEREKRRLKRPIVWENHRSGFVQKIQYIKRDKVIKLYTGNATHSWVFYEIDTEGMTRSKAQEWFWHITKKLWMLNTQGAMEALCRILQDVLSIQKKKMQKKAMQKARGEK